METIANESPPPLAADSTPPPIPAAKKPRLWPTLLVLLGALPCYLIAQFLLLVLAVLLFTDEGLSRLLRDEERLQSAFAEVLQEPMGLVFYFLPSQALLFLLSFTPATFARHPLRRLGLRRWRIPTTSVACFVLATPLCQLAGGLLVKGLGLEDSSQLEFLTQVVTGQRGLGLVLMLGFFTLGAGITEELLFRGYVQTRLAERWPAWLAVLVPAIFFAAMHADPAHSVAVFPLGLWFGFLARVSGSVVPAIAAHVLNNLVGVGLMLWMGGNEAEAVEVGLAYLALLGACALLLALGVFRLRRARSVA